MGMADPIAIKPQRGAVRVRTGALEQSRRIVNIAAAVSGIIITLPIMAVVAVLVRCSSSGPVFYTQTRIGLDRRKRRNRDGREARQCDLGGRPFTIYKFRTMRVTPRQPQAWARPDDDRVTPMGRVLRKFRLDELPQLFNVLRGDMNVVGPRPEQPEIFAELREQVERYPWRQWVLPGITGWAQVNQGYDRNLDDVRRKLEFDLQYLVRRSPVEDARIMLRTLPVMLGRRGGW
jgi:lipopolysaccharide/colanic/teichoic acid biosynthesis glycosyltransferase